MDAQRHLARRLGAVEGPAKGVRRGRAGELDRHRLAGLGVLHPHLDRLLRQPVEHGRDLFREVGEGGVAGGLGRAVAGEELKRLLGVPGVIQRGRLARLHHRGEDDGPHRLRVAGEEDLGREGAVGGAAQVHPAVARGGAAPRRRRPWPPPWCSGRGRPASRARRGRRRPRRGGRCGRAGVPSPQIGTGEGSSRPCRGRRRGRCPAAPARGRRRTSAASRVAAPAGTAFEEEDGVRRRFGPRRRQEDDLQRDLPPGAGRRGSRTPHRCRRKPCRPPGRVQGASLPCQGDGFFGAAGAAAEGGGRREPRRRAGRHGVPGVSRAGDNPFLRADAEEGFGTFWNAEVRGRPPAGPASRASHRPRSRCRPW